MASGLWIERSGFEPWLGSLCCVLGQDSAQESKWISANVILIGLLSTSLQSLVRNTLLASCNRNLVRVFNWPKIAVKFKDIFIGEWKRNLKKLRKTSWDLTKILKNFLLRIPVPFYFPREISWNLENYNVPLPPPLREKFLNINRHPRICRDRIWMHMTF